jgi:hypothetical protein
MIKTKLIVAFKTYNKKSMKKLILFILFITISLVSYNQVITGTVFDKKTNLAIDFASIYFNGTFVGTNSDLNGKFKLDISNNASMPLTISAIGYNSVALKLTDFSIEEPFLVYMTPKVFELQEVVIGDKSLARKRRINLFLFKNAFLGSTANARNCEIINEKDIRFNYDSDRDTLRAFSSKPIIIDNRSLGYKVTYFLDEFELNKQNDSFYFLGSIIFNEDLTVDETKKKLYEAKREKAYIGSRMHFFRSLWENNLDSAGFVIRNEVGKNLGYKDIVFQEDSLIKFLKYPEKLYLRYDGRPYPSYIIFHDEEVYFEKNGYFNPLGIEWEGQMGNQRIADMLPYEYELK